MDSALWLHSLCLLHRPQYPLPHRVAVQVATLKHGVGPHGGLGRRVFAVLLHEHLGGAEDIQVGDHSLLNDRAHTQPVTHRT